MKKIKTPYLIVAVLLVVLAVGGFVGYQRYSYLKKENQRLSNPQEATKSEIEKTKSQVSALIEVPTDEEPTIANVVDVTKLSSQEFFKNAKNGDKLLVYQKSKKAILYRPETNKIIEVSTINIGSEANKEVKTPSSTAQTDQAKENPSSGVDAALPGLQQ